VDKNLIILSLTALVVLSSACTNPSDEGPESDKSVEIHSLDVSPDEVYDEGYVTARLELENAGELPAKIDVGKNGENILNDHCPDVLGLEKEGSFQKAPEEYFNEGSKNTAELQPGEGLTLQWRLKQKGEVPLYGKKCDLNFQVPFEYKVSAYRQLQFKSSENVEGSDLTWESSSGPMVFDIETISGTGDEGRHTFIEGPEKELTALLQLYNQGREEINKGVVEVDEDSLEISFDLPGYQFTEKFEGEEMSACSGVNSGLCIVGPRGASGGSAGSVAETGAEGESGTGYVHYYWTREGAGGSTICNMDNDNALRMSEGKSRLIKCNMVNLFDKVDVGESPSQLGTIEAEINYTYIKQAGSRRVEVKYSR